ncbi:hypothetical protein B0H17DRAFT_1143352 [Mycena rosella]|uniref:Uncharacterized protein n=1 Tax=Mycena rosella TaxID=1033263 RepID=A0AAD7CWD7_MYCRO|nr:hypothetical protein B0H17DRAFT_1143352 [Mycena rosella]
MASAWLRLSCSSSTLYFLAAYWLSTPSLLALYNSVPPRTLLQLHLKLKISRMYHFFGISIALGTAAGKLFHAWYLPPMFSVMTVSDQGDSDLLNFAKSVAAMLPPPSGTGQSYPSSAGAHLNLHGCWHTNTPAVVKQVRLLQQRLLRFTNTELWGTSARANATACRRAWIWRVLAIHSALWLLLTALLTEKKHYEVRDPT